MKISLSINEMIKEAGGNNPIYFIGSDHLLTHLFLFVGGNACVL